MSLVTIDERESVYRARQLVDPSFSYVLREVKREHVNAVDRLVASIGNRETVSTESDWVALEQVIRFYCDRWPDDFRQFSDTIPDIRHSRRAGGYSRTGEIKYVGALPFRLERLIKICFPMQQFDKEFVYKLVKRIKLLKVGGEQN